MNPSKKQRVYDYVKGRNTVPMSDRYNFDVDKLVNSGVVFITPSIDGDPRSKTYKKWLNNDGSHLITLRNVLHSSPKSWIHKAITKKADTSEWKSNFIEKLYDGKYNQILWSLEKLGIDPNDMIIEDNSLQENILRIKEVMGLNEVFDDIIGTPLYHKTSTLRGLNIINSDALRAGSLPSGDYLAYDKRLARTKHQNAISFTRDKNWEPNSTIGIGLESPLEDTNMTFVLDRNKLRTKYRVEPFNYSSIEPDYEHHNKNEELEERVMTNEIYPLHRYLIDIIYTGDDPEVQQQIDKYLNK